MYQNIFWTKRTGPGSIQVQLNQKYEIKQGDQLYETIQIIVGELNYKNSKHNKFPKPLGITYYPSIEFGLSKSKIEEEICPICLCQFEHKQVEKQVNEHSEQDIYALKCSHRYHQHCLQNMLAKNGGTWVKCAVCMAIYGKMMGDQPEGKMTYNVDKNMKCQGYAKGTIIINYSFSGCVRNGIHVPGTGRVAYLPNNQEGNEVLALLRQCFDRKLTFTVGRSVTTGMDNQIVWNGIHHKTSLYGGSASFGYPDPTYLKRVKQELAAKGIVSKGK